MNARGVYHSYVGRKLELVSRARDEMIGRVQQYLSPAMRVFESSVVVVLIRTSPDSAGLVSADH